MAMSCLIALVFLHGPAPLSGCTFPLILFTGWNMLVGVLAFRGILKPPHRHSTSLHLLLLLSLSGGAAGMVVAFLLLGRWPPSWSARWALAAAGLLGLLLWGLLFFLLDCLRF
jgi:hypothetical protein